MSDPIETLVEESQNDLVGLFGREQFAMRAAMSLLPARFRPLDLFRSLRLRR